MAKKASKTETPNSDGLVWVKPSRRLTKADREYYRVSWDFWKRHEATPTWDGKPTDEDHAMFCRGMDYFARTGRLPKNDGAIGLLATMRYYRA